MTKIWALSLRNEVKPERKQASERVLEFKNGRRSFVLYSKESDAKTYILGVASVG